LYTKDLINARKMERTTIQGEENTVDNMILYTKDLINARKMERTTI